LILGIALVRFIYFILIILRKEAFLIPSPITHLSFVLEIDPGCGKSVAIRGGKSYLRTNPSLLSVVTSLRNITSALNMARDEWWKTSSSTEETKECDPSIMDNVDRQTEVSSVQNEKTPHKTATLDIDAGDGEEEIVDLQANHTVQELKTPSHWLQRVSSLKKRFFPYSAASESLSVQDSNNSKSKRIKFQHPSQDELLFIQSTTSGSNTMSSSSSSSSDSPSTIVYDKLDEINTSIDETPFKGNFAYPYSPSITQSNRETKTITTSLIHPPVDELMIGATTFAVKDTPKHLCDEDYTTKNNDTQIQMNRIRTDNDHQISNNTINPEDTYKNIQLDDHAMYPIEGGDVVRTPMNKNGEMNTVESPTTNTPNTAIPIDSFEIQLKKIQRLKNAIDLAKNGKGISAEKLAALEKTLEEAEAIYADMVLEDC